MIRAIESKDLNMDFYRKLMSWCVEYIDSTGDSSIMPFQLIELAERASLTKNRDLTFGFWLVFEQDQLAGYILTELLQSDRGLDFNVNQAYLSQVARNNGVQEQMWDVFSREGMNSNCNYITASSRRKDGRGFVRWMERLGFRQRCVVVEKSLKEMR